MRVLRQLEDSTEPVLYVMCEREWILICQTWVTVVFTNEMMDLNGGINAKMGEVGLSKIYILLSM